MFDISLTELGYIAGLLDGEGTISFRKDGKGKIKYVRIAITLITPEPLRWLVIVIPRSHLYKCHKRQHGIESDYWYWCLVAQKSVYGFLRTIIPYLKIKQSKALEAISFMKRTSKIYSYTPWEEYLKRTEITASQKSFKFNL